MNNDEYNVYRNKHDGNTVLMVYYKRSNVLPRRFISGQDSGVTNKTTISYGLKLKLFFVENSFYIVTGAAVCL